MEPFAGGLELLKPIKEAATPFEAVGIWWAQRVLAHDHRAVVPQNPSTQLQFLKDIASLQEQAVEARPHITSKIGGFSLAVAYLSEQRNERRLHTEYMFSQASEVLVDAAGLSGLVDYGLDGSASMTLLPWQHHSRVEADHTVLARAGDAPLGEELVVIWTPSQ